MYEKEYEVPDGSLYYRQTEDGICITRFQGNASQVCIPETIEGSPVTTIGKKAFLSRKFLRRVYLPSTVREVQEWAFAYCSVLSEVFVHVHKVIFGRAVFLDCNQLKRIAPTNREEAPGFEPELLSAALLSLDAYYLLELPEVGHKEWLSKWDAKLSEILHAPDDNGYSKQVLCGEEDYGSTDLVAFMSRSREQKCRLAMLRLLHPAGLSKALEQELTDYLKSHTKGCEQEESFRVLLNEHGEDKEYYELFAAIGCVNSDNMNKILECIGEKYPEMKAYFIKVCGTGSDSTVDAFFDDLEL